MQPQRIIYALIVTIFIGLLQIARAVVPPPDGGYPGRNTAEGQKALLSLTTGTDNTAVGYSSLQGLTTGSLNTGVGAWALALNSADNNTAVGTAAMFLNTSGHDNAANGTAALLYNDDGNFNTANGAFALYLNVSGSSNAATGAGALQNNLNGNYNAAHGGFALFFNTAGSHNTAVGDSALYYNDSGSYNVAIGNFALLHNDTGTSNIGIGASALDANTAGTDNTAIGDSALLTATGSNCIAIGSQAGSLVGSSNNVIAIGSPGDDVDNSCYIGNIYSNVQPIVGTDPDTVTITSMGQLGRGNVSSRRYKHDIKPMDKASEALYALKPVSFRYHKEYDATQTLAFGLIAEEVAEVYPDLVGRNPKGEPESVRYEQINAMLLNEFLKEHRKVQEQEATIVHLTKQIETILAHSKEQDSQIQRVRDQVQMNRLGARVVVRN
jgi:hypothetical protein